MWTKSGFTLIEWLIYFFLITIVLTGIFHFVATVQQRSSGLKKRTNLFSHMCSIQDALAHDIMTAPTNPKNWDECGPSSLVWRNGDVKVRWKRDGKRLIREKSTFDVSKKTWTSQRKSVVAHTITGTKFSLSYWVPTIKGKSLGRTIQSVSCVLACSVASQECVVERTVMLRNRIIE